MEIINFSGFKDYRDLGNPHIKLHNIVNSFCSEMAL